MRERIDRGLALETAWLRVVNPALGFMRLSLYAALILGPEIGLPISTGVRLVAAVIAAGQGVLHLGVALGRISSTALAQGVLADVLLTGFAVGGPGMDRVLAGLGAALVIAIAYLAGAGRLAFVATIGTAIGFLIGRLVPDADPGASVARVARRFILEAETTYHGRSSWTTSLDAPVALLAAFGAICFACAIALYRAGRARRRALQTCADADALEAIVDAHTLASDEEFWNVVLRNVSTLSGARVYVAHADAGLIRLRSPEGSAAGTEIEQTAEWVLQNIRIPLAALSNPLARALAQGTEEEAQGIADLCTASVRSLSADVIDKLRMSWRMTFFIAPCGPHSSAALVAVVPQVTDSARRGLRAAATRLAVALKRRTLTDASVAAPLAMGGEA